MLLNQMALLKLTMDSDRKMYTVQCTLYNCKLYSILSYDIGIPYLHVLKNFEQMIILLSMIVHLKLESSGMLAIIGIAAMLRCLW